MRAGSDPRNGLQEQGVDDMFGKLALSTAIAVSALAALPATATAQSRQGYYDGRHGGYNQGYRSDSRRYDNRRYNGRYAQRYDNRRYGNYYGRSCRNDGD